ncbi:MAG: hypothetical protein ACREJB_11125 [Planctomycetaceae bacterium]
MKGPGMRLDLDVRRVWECPACGTRIKLPGREVARRCHQCEGHPWMRLVEDKPKPRRFTPPAATADADPFVASSPADNISDEDPPGAAGWL